MGWIAAIAVGDHDHAVDDDGRRRRDLGVRAQPPQLLPRRRIVGADELRGLRDELVARRAHVHRRRAPGGDLLPRRAPRLPAVLQAVGGDEGVLLAVDLHDHQVLVDDGRAGGAPLVVGVVEPARVHAPEVLLPSQGAVHVVGVEPLGAEVRDHHLAVGDRRARGLAGLGMALRLRHAFVRHALPAHAAGLLVDGQQAPGMRRHVGRGLDVAVEAVAERGARIAAHGGGDEDRVAPDDGAGDGETRDGRLPREPAPLAASHVVGVLCPSATPDAWGPRNEGQSCAPSKRRQRARG